MLLGVKILQFIDQFQYFSSLIADWIFQRFDVSQALMIFDVVSNSISIGQAMNSAVEPILLLSNGNFTNV